MNEDEREGAPWLARASRTSGRGIEIAVICVCFVLAAALTVGALAAMIVK